MVSEGTRDPSGRYLHAPAGSQAAGTSGLVLPGSFLHALPNLYAQLYARAQAGDVQALRVLLDRLDPLRKGAPVELPGLPAITNAASAIAASAEVLHLVAAGEVTPDEAAAVSKLIELHVRAIEVHELDARLAALEARAENQR